MIGFQRFVEILINILIPCFIALANKRGSQGFKNYLQEFYFFISDPGLKYMIIERKMPWFKDYYKIFPKAAFWQALLNLEKIHCSPELCFKCPVNRSMPSE